MAQVTTHSSEQLQTKNLFINPPGSQLTTTPSQQKPVHNLTTDHLVGPSLHKELAMYWVRHYLSQYNDILLRVLPPTNIEFALKVTVTEWEFDGDLAGEVPEGTVSTLVGAATRRSEKEMQRRGKGAKVSTDIMNTEEGRRLLQEFSRNIAESFMNVIKLDIQRELFSPTYAQCLVSSYLRRITLVDLETIIRHEVQNFLPIARDVYLLKRLFDVARKNMEDEGRDPNMILLPPGTISYLKNDFNKLHQTVLKNGVKAIDYQGRYPFRMGPNNPNQTWSLCGLPTYELSAIVEASTVGAINATESTRSIGRHFFLSNALSPNNGDCYVYDLQTDNMKKYSMLDALQESGFFSGKFIAWRASSSTWPQAADATFEAFYNSSPAYQAAIRDGGHLDKAELKERIDDPQNWAAMIYAGIPLPVNVMVCQPEIKIKTSSAAILRAGSETGNVFITMKNPQSGLDVRHQNVITNVTMRSAAVVTESGRKNISIIPNVMPCGFVDAGKTYYMVTLFHENSQTKNYIDIKGTANNLPVYGELKAHGGGDKIYSYSTSDFYRKNLWNLDTEFPDQNAGLPYHYESSKRNRLTFQTTQYCYNSAKQDYSRVISSCGHIPDKGNQPGAKKVFRGNKMFYDELNMKKMMLYCP